MSGVQSGKMLNINGNIITVLLPLGGNGKWGPRQPMAPSGLRPSGAIGCPGPHFPLPPGSQYSNVIFPFYAQLMKKIILGTKQ